MAQTVTATKKPRRNAAAGEPCLFVAFQCDRPLDGGARFSLSGLDACAVGRAPRLGIERVRVEGAREARIGIPDPRMSAAHARLQRVLGSWVVADAGSKNGTVCDGRQVERAPLPDGALLEVGHTFLIFREALAGGTSDALGPAADAPSADSFTRIPAFAHDLDRLFRVAPSRLPVLLQGETGTGKEVVARAIHTLSGRTGPFLAINCGALAPELVESQLFGHRKGAFTGAIDDHLGLFRAAEGGTLLLDEVGDLPLPAQAALLRVLQEEEVVPVGSARAVKIDVRVVSATHRDLDGLIEAKRFRTDLLARLSGYRCTLPPLRERREDFALLAAALLQGTGAGPVTFTPEAARALLRYRWPLNVRELQRCLESAAALAGGGQVDREHLPPAVNEAGEAPPPAEVPVAGADGARRAELVELLQQHGGNVSAVARTLGKARTQVQRWLRRFRIDPLSFRR